MSNENSLYHAFLRSFKCFRQHWPKHDDLAELHLRSGPSASSASAFWRFAIVQDVVSVHTIGGMSRKPRKQWIRKFEPPAKTFFQLAFDNTRVSLCLSHRQLRQAIGGMITFWTRLFNNLYALQVRAYQSE